MRILLTIILLICIVFLAIFSVAVLTNESTELELNPNTPSDNTLPGNAGVTPFNPSTEPAQVQLQTLYGQTLTTNNFKSIAGVRSVGSDMYTYDSNRGYQVIFNENDSSFAINLSERPLTRTKDRAVQALADELGLPVVDLCLLNIYISTTYDFDPTTAGKNLGIDVCNN